MPVFGGPDLSVVCPKGGHDVWCGTVAALAQEAKVFFREGAEISVDIGVEGVHGHLVGGLGFAEVFIWGIAGAEGSEVDRGKTGYGEGARFGFVGPAIGRWGDFVLCRIIGEGLGDGVGWCWDGLVGGGGARGGGGEGGTMFTLFFLGWRGD